MPLSTRSVFFRVIMRFRVYGILLHQCQAGKQSQNTSVADNMVEPGLRWDAALEGKPERDPSSQRELFRPRLLDGQDLLSLGSGNDAARGPGLYGPSVELRGDLVSSRRLGPTRSWPKACQEMSHRKTAINTATASHAARKPATSCPDGTLISNALNGNSFLRGWVTAPFGIVQG